MSSLKKFLLSRPGRFLLTIYRYLVQFGFIPLHFLGAIKNIGWYIRDSIHIKKAKLTEFKITFNHPCLHDKEEDGGTAKGDYFHQDLLIAQKIYKANSKKHVDVGSRVDGFVAHVASFRPIEVFDIRKNYNQVQNITFIQGDLMQLDSKYENYCDSISSLHAIEHFGLGRYGDSLDINGHLKGLKSITSMLKKGGTFYFSVPIGNPQRIEFNAHRVFSLRYLMDTCINLYTYQLKDFSYVDDQGILHINIALDEKLIKNSCGCNYGCGIFELQKK